MKALIQLSIDVETVAAFKRAVGDGNVSRTVDDLMRQYVKAHTG